MLTYLLIKEKLERDCHLRGYQGLKMKLQAVDNYTSAHHQPVSPASQSSLNEPNLAFPYLSSTALNYQCHFRARSLLNAT